MVGLILISLFFAWSNALLTLFIDFCLGDLSKSTRHTINKGRIFSKIGKFVFRKHEEFEENQIILMADIDKPFKTKINWWKIWICPICMNIWLGLMSSAALFFGGILNPWLIIPYLVISNFFVRIHMKHL